MLAEEDNRLAIFPATKLTREQAARIGQHKAGLLAEIRRWQDYREGRWDPFRDGRWCPYLD